ncbi:hypothetical protein BTUL_0010g00840 [Botrytis tulipae]|uniref:Uncharacterized protein n=1 Tax=Botrytis tulipae TaxID=87230 RepID=A0A4Z1F1E3_9HELO|nr:hypothetical protein BTUL_0010g00840 [Botrytis tulipae]
MPNLQQQQRNRRAQLHAIREEQNWLRTMQRTYLGLAMTQYARELILERRNRNYRREIQQDQTPRLNITLASRSLILTTTEPHLQKVLAYILIFVFGSDSFVGLKAKDSQHSRIGWDCQVYRKKAENRGVGGMLDG